jgi:formate hydrogenlyase subunit 6/NADH:ubiquinone oxidoreductase subunit I
LATREVEALIDALVRRGYDVIGPTLRDDAIVYERLSGAADLPVGWIDVQVPGQYRLERGESGALFGYTVGPQSWKPYLHPAQLRLWSAERKDGAFELARDAPKPARPLAFFGVRACDLAALAIQQRVLEGDSYRDPTYTARRENLFVVAVQCTRAASTCFCASMGSGPRASKGFDLALTEVGGELLVEVGTDAGAEVLADLPTNSPTAALVAAATAAVAAAARQTRSINPEEARQLLVQHFEHPRWDQVGARCLACGNCTMACPTCFCTTFEDTSDLTGTRAERWRRWDSCFTTSFSYIHGGSMRASSPARYRHWITHKLATWVDQFGTPGCVGCGRCITWCPAGIDITEEIRAIRGG